MLEKGHAQESLRSATWEGGKTMTPKLRVGQGQTRSNKVRCGNEPRDSGLPSSTKVVGGSGTQSSVLTGVTKA